MMAEEAPNLNPQADTPRPLGRTELDYLDLASELEVEKPVFRQADQPERFRAWADRVDQLVVYAWRGQTERFNDLKVETNVYAGHPRDDLSTQLQEYRSSPQRRQADTLPDRGELPGGTDQEGRIPREEPNQRGARIDAPALESSSLRDPLADAVSPPQPADPRPNTTISPAEHIEQLQAELRNSALISPEEKEQIQGELTRALAEAPQATILDSKALAAKRDPTFVETRSVREIERDDILEAAQRFEAAGRTQVAANLSKDAAIIDLTRPDEDAPNDNRPDTPAVTGPEAPRSISAETPDSPRPPQRDRIAAAEAELGLFNKSPPSPALPPIDANPPPRRSVTLTDPGAARQASEPDARRSQPAQSLGPGGADSPRIHAAAPQNERSPIAGASTPAGSNLSENDASETQSAPKQAETQNPKDPAKQQKPAPHITLSGPGGALYDIFSAMRRDKPDAAVEPESRPAQPAQATAARSQEDYSNRFAKFEQKNMRPRRDAEALAGADASAQAALDALNSFENHRSASVLNRMQAAAKAHPEGMPGVISEMKAGGPYEDLRKEFNSALDTDRGFAESYKKAASALSLYGDKRAEINPILANPPNPQIAAKFEKFDDEISDAASKLPGLKQGASAIDELTEKAREILHKAFERVSAALKHAAGANAEASPSPSPSPGP